MPVTTPLCRVTSSRVLIVGGGIAGLEAALGLAEMGVPVTLAEQGPSLGGLMAQLDKTFPTNDCAMCILSPRMLAAARHPLIEILTLTRLQALAGEAGNFLASLSRRPRYVDPARCSGCGECTRVCPQTLPDPFNLGLSQGKAIRLPFPQAIPQAAILSPEACRLFQGKPCQACIAVCPAGAIDLGQQPETLLRPVGAVILATGTQPAPVADFPGAHLPEVFTSLEFERLMSATGPLAGQLVRPADGAPLRRLAFLQCVGSRDLRHGAPYCSAHCCLASLKEAVMAMELSPPGLQAVIFAMDLRAPGKGQEDYLEQALARGVQVIRSRATEVRKGEPQGVVVRYADHRGRAGELAFDLAVLAVGQRPGGNLPDLARRLGLLTDPYGYLCADGPEPWQSSRPGVFMAGAAREPGDITEAITAAGAAAQSAATLLALGPRVWPTAGRPLPSDQQGGESCRIGVFLCHCGTNIAKTVDLSRLAREVQLLPEVALVSDFLFACSGDATQHLKAVIKEHRLNRVVVAACTPRTHEAVFREVLAEVGLNPGFLAFANIREQCAWVHQRDPAGALAAAKSIVTMAVSRARQLRPIARKSFPVIPRALVVGGGVAGMKAALSLAHQGFHTYLVERDRHLGGLARRLFFTLEGPDPQKLLQNLEAAVFSHPNIEVRTGSEVVAVRGQVGRFVTRIRTPHRRQPEILLEHGVLLVATGGREFLPAGRFLYGRDPRVLTQLELEERLAERDPELARQRTVVMIQCVGSREPERPWCSRVCCSEALKNAILLKKCQPLLEVMVLYRDLRAYGRRESFYQEAKELGVRFLPYEAQRPPRISATPGRPLTVTLWNELLGQEVPLSADLVVLSTGLEPSPGSAELARLLALPLAPGGFFQEAHPKLRPVETLVEGVYLCGLAHSPRSLTETLAQAEAAALKAGGLLAHSELLSGEVYAQVERRHCRRCLSCIGLCPYGALFLGADGRPQVAVEACRGCGVCAAACPARAISLSRESESEIMAQIQAALAG